MMVSHQSRGLDPAVSTATMRRVQMLPMFMRISIRKCANGLDRSGAL